MIVFGTDSELVVAEVAGETSAAGATADDAAPARPSAPGVTFSAVRAAPIALPLGAPITADDPGSDRVRVLCDESSALLVIATASGVLHTLRCDAATAPAGVDAKVAGTVAGVGAGAVAAARTLHCTMGSGAPVATHVAGFDAARTKDGALIAYSQALEPQLRVLRLDAAGKPRGAPTTPAACWDPAGGMCGKPTLASDSGRLLLCARDGTDLLVLESDDGGARWKPMSGLKVGSATSTDASSPMDQHRLRKGLE